jgi:SHS2 domain-containing protein
MADKKFEVIEHTADIGLAAYGKDLKEAFANAAYGMTSMVIEPGELGESVVRPIQVSSDDIEGLLVRWLSEFIYFFDTIGLLFKRFDIESLTDTHLKARVFGERYDPQKHRLKRGIKAVTRHMLKVEQKDGVEIRVIFDI